MMILMRRNARYIVTAAALAAVAGCSDTSTGPASSASRVPAPSDRPSLDYNNGAHFGGYRTATFSLTLAGGTFNIGNGFYTLTVPANAVCEQTSSYGPGTWDDACSTLQHGQSITVTATYGFSNTGPVVDFSPELRFSPDAQVTLSTSLYAAMLTSGRGYFSQHPSALRNFAIYYLPSLGAPLVTDAATDPTLVTHVNLQTGLVWRRIKHFSGYSVASGRACDPSPDNPDCVDSGTAVIDPQ